MKNTDLFSFNGINGATGGYLTPKMSVAAISQVARGEKFDKNDLLELTHRLFYGKKKVMDLMEIQKIFLVLAGASSLLLMTATRSPPGKRPSSLCLICAKNRLATSIKNTQAELVSDRVTQRMSF